MALGVYQSFGGFRRHFDRCADIMLESCGINIGSLVYPNPDHPADDLREGGLDLREMLRRNETDSILGGARTGHLSLFAVQYAFAQLLLETGVTPGALLGHSVGEFAAACTAGVLELPEMIRLIDERARLIEQIAEGSMVAVFLPEADVVERLGPDISLAAVNTWDQCVLSGAPAAIADLVDEFEAVGTPYRRLATRHAFHSDALHSISNDWRAIVERYEFKPARIPWISTVTGDWIRLNASDFPEYWLRQMQSTVRFADACRSLWNSVDVLVELGPGSLGGYAIHARPDDSGSVVTTARHVYNRVSDRMVFLRALEHLRTCGCDLDWQAASDKHERDLSGTVCAAAPPPSVPRRTADHKPSDAADGTVTRSELPATPLEMTVAKCWCSILGRNSIGRHDDFFELGGDSLRAGKILWMLESELGAELHPRVFFQSPSVAGVAASIEAWLAQRT